MTSETGLYVYDMGKGKYGLRYYQRNPFQNGLDITELGYITDPKSRAKVKTRFDQVVRLLNPGVDPEVLREELRDQVIGLIPRYEEEEVEEVETDKSVTEYDQLGRLVIRKLGADFEEKFKLLLSCIVSLWYAETESIYIVILALPGSGKSTLCSCFNDCRKYVHVIDNLSAHALDPGTATDEQESVSVLDESRDKTLVVHDLTALFSEKGSNIKRFKGVFENIYGQEGFIKASPGSGSKRYGGRMNLIFGVTPYIFWQKYQGETRKIGGDLINSERYLYIHLPQRDHYNDYVEGRIVREMTEIQQKTAGFLDNLKERFFKPEITKEIRIKIAKAVVEYYFESDFESETGTRRMKQCEMFCKALMLIEGKREITDEMIEKFVDLLHLRDPKREKNGI